jgi:hypothetical protein
MSRLTALFVGVAALTVVSTVAEARGWVWKWLVLQWTTLRAAARRLSGVSGLSGLSAISPA